MKKVFTYNSLIAIILMFGIISCSEDEEPTPFIAVGDVYYMNKEIDGKKQTAIVYYAFGDKAIASATATSPSGASVSLDESKNSSFTVFNEPKNEDFNENYPEDGTYIFEIVSNEGNQLQSSDLLQIKNLEIPEITEIRYEDLDSSYEIEWNLVNKANGYLIKLFDELGELVFTSDELGSGASSFTLIQDYEGTWEKDIVFGNTYTVLLHAFVYDSDANGNNNLYNIEEVSLTDEDFVWDEN